MKALRRAGVSAAWLAVFGISGAAVAAPDRLRAEIDTSRSVILHGSLRPQLRTATDLGRLDPATRLENVTIHFSRSPQQQAELESLLAEQQAPGSPAWHRWLTPAQFGERFGLGDGDLQRVQRWLAREGLEVRWVAPGRNQISLRGTAVQFEQAFGIQLHRYRYDGSLHFASAVEPRLPAALDGMVLGLRNLDDFKLHTASIARHSVSAGEVSPQFTDGSGGHELVPDDIATIYDINPLYKQNIDGSQVTIAIVGRTIVDMTDVYAFRTDAGLPNTTVGVSSVPGTENGSGSSDPNDLVESDLDLEWSGAIAYNAGVVYVTTNGMDGYDVTDSLAYAIQADIAPIVSMSYGECEPQTTSSDIATFTSLGEQAGTQGQTLIASAGDSGAAACDPQGDSSAPQATLGLAVNFPADLAEVTGIGGTQFSGDVISPALYWSSNNSSDGGSAKFYIPETAWNDGGSSGLASGGGGVSTLVPKPDWQGGPGVPNDGQRDVPDLSFTASWNHDPYLICTGGSCSGGGFASDTPVAIGGTSASAPVFAGMLALIENAYASTGEGNINPQLYTLAKNSSVYASAFHDITTGSNAVPCQAGTPDCPQGTTAIGYDAGTGYDLATGLGSLDLNKFLPFYVPGGLIETQSQLDVSPNRVQQGDWVTLILTITPERVGNEAVLGTVQFELDGTNIGDPVTVVNQQAVLKITPQTLGVHTIKATYSGSTSYNLSETTGSLSVLAQSPADDSKDGGGGALPPVMLALLGGLAAWRQRRRMP